MEKSLIHAVLTEMLQFAWTATSKAYIQIVNKENIHETYQAYESDLQHKAILLEEMNILLDDRFHFQNIHEGESIIDDTIDKIKNDIVTALEKKREEMKNNLKVIKDSSDMFIKDYRTSKKLSVISRNKLGLKRSQASLKVLAKTMDMVDKLCEGNQGLEKRHEIVRDKMDTLVANNIPEN